MCIRLWCSLIIVQIFIQGLNSRNVAQRLLEEHNKYRSKHQTPDLKLNYELNKFAEDWATYLVKNNLFEHRKNNKYGENLWMGPGSKEQILQPNGPNPVKDWYDEIANYPGKKFHEWGHFTQVIWKNSKYLGCGIVENNSKVYVVCNYNPPGNVEGQYDENVLTKDGKPFSKSKSLIFYILGIAIVTMILILVVVFIFFHRFSF